MSVVFINLNAETFDKPPSRDDILEMVDDALSHRPYYMERRRHESDSLRILIEKSTDIYVKMDLMLERGLVIRPISSDSAIRIFTQGLELSTIAVDSVMAQKFILNRALALMYTGQIYDALNDHQHVGQVGVKAENDSLYNQVGGIMYLTIGAFNEYNAIGTDYYDRAISHLRNALGYHEPGSIPYIFCKSLIAYAEEDYRAMEKLLLHLLEDADPSIHEYSLAHAMLGEYYLLQERYDKAFYHFGLGAIGDITKAYLNEVSLLKLGIVLNQMGDYNRAGTYLGVALEDAIQADVKFNLMRINNAYTEAVTCVYRDRVKQISMLVVLLVVLAVLLLVVVKMTMDKRREVKHLREIESRLAKANKAKETYINEFMNLCSNYMELLESYNKMCRRKIAAGQTEWLLAYIKNGKVLDEARSKFYDVFDEAFLQLFPDFIESVNTLLLPDRQIAVSSPMRLTTELRIAAFSRLGIEDVAIIARFLGISTNTIYTYRNKLRTRAKDRTVFDDQLRRISSI